MFIAYIDPGSGFTIVGAGGGIIALLLGFLGTFSLFFRRICSFFKRHKKIFVSGFIVVLGLITAGVIMKKSASEFKDKIIILGFDGLSPDIMESMMAEGKLPNFERLKKAGSYRRLATTNPAQSPVAWASFATGKNPGKTGIFDFIVRDPADYGLRLSLSDPAKGGKPQKVIKDKCFWNYTSERKVPTVVISHPLTYPPDKIYGRMLSGMGVPDILGTEGTFSFYTTESIDESKDIGGKVFHVNKASRMQVDLIGPRVATTSGAENVTVPIEVTMKGDKATIEYQNKKVEIETGEWSDWNEVVFKVGPLKKAKGIFKLYLVETEPEFKLYISPINFDPRDPFFQISHPAGYAKELTDKTGLYYTQGMPADTWAVNEKRLDEEAFLKQIDTILKQKQDVLDLELGRMKNGVLFCYFGASDIIQHMFWRYTDAEHLLYEKDAPQEYKEMIRTWYKKIDGILGEVLDKLDKDDTIIVLSDHGFDTFRRAAHVNTWLRDNGYLKLRNAEAESGEELLADIDWSGTKAYAIGFGSIYINQKGREAEGVVEEGKETDLLIEDISRQLKEWTDDKHNEPVIKNVYKNTDIFWGPYSDKAPDLYIGFNKGYRASWQTAIGGVPKGLIEDNLKKWSGSHLFDPELIPGILFCNKQIKKENPSIMDITPTILEIVGEGGAEKKNDMDGSPLL